MGGLREEVESSGKKPVLPAIKWEERGVPGNLRAKVRSEGGLIPRIWPSF